MTIETPFPYQIVGANFLSEHKTALLADEMGLGKSAQAVRACDLVSANRILVICPAAVRINWSREFTRFSPFDRSCTVVSSAKDKIPAFGVVVISYDFMAKEANRKFIYYKQWDVVILDEAHYLKNREAKRTKAIYGANIKSGIKSNWLWLLSGTPAPNCVSELWPHLKKAEIFNESYWVFLDMYTTGRVTDYGYIPTGTKNANKLKTLLAKFMLRRKKDDVMKDLPPISFCDVAIERSSVDLHPYFSSEINVTGDATTFLAQLKNSSLALKSALDSICTTQKTQLKDILSLLQGLEVSQATLRRYIGMAKVPTFCELISAELDDNPKMKIVIFAVHKSVIESISKMLAKYKPVTLNGSTATEKRQANIDKFQNDPVCRVFIGNIKAAGTGITLTTASEVAFIEASYTPADNAQAAMRCHRIGQTKHVRVRFFACAGSDDELIMNVLRRKTAELAKIF